MSHDKDNGSLDQFLRRLVTAPRAKQAEAVQSALALLDGAPENALLHTTAQSARMLNISKPSFWRLVKNHGIEPVNIPGFARPRYRRSDLEKLAAGKMGNQ